ncbi:hypothetical protein Glove_117g528 [Diversispora epigaea]|uniref:Uncharacterized protein n=1 Tax=Diversispora epigaea TaxID=1348612 RepID=A0A397J0P0_9GLOM|nr:hypothetical protein Glove_117g528 [Diversispora epigaea]
MMFAEKIPVHLILANICFAIYVIRQQITADLNARVERLTTDFTLRNATFIIEEQRIMMMVNTVIETINGITTNYESLRDQLDHLTETGSIAPLISEQFNTPPSSNSSQRSSHASSSGSSHLSFFNIISTTWNKFKIIFDRIMAENDYSLDDMCNTVSVEIRDLGVGKISKETVKKFYYNDSDLRGGTLKKIGSWIDSKNNLAINTE